MIAIALTHNKVESQAQLHHVHTNSIIRDGSKYYAVVDQEEIDRLSMVGYTVGERVLLRKKDQTFDIPTLADGESWSADQ